MAAVEAQRPDDGILSEESIDNSERLAKSRVWIVDPLDGTREYSEGRDDWAVHVALAVDGRVVSGAVAQPGMNRAWSTVGVDAPTLVGPQCIVVSRTRTPQIAHDVAQLLGIELLPMGSAGAKTMAVVRGEAIAYIHAGGQYEWDSAAPAAVAMAAGLDVTRLDGSPLVYNQKDTYMPDLLVTRPDWTQRLARAVARAANSEITS
jgi:3'(2'), 5'-bisphosphate nucleotidase